ncbi:cytochrome P450 4d8 [Scaptodrosophila lebanonensis]|uniref:Cytochrome P450 4d8 n=1 Tax=Drosophila lebanonensis TaxID=7225 RepID=A0A6J2TXR1_DROLE|nr:cytochrome P450 4d8 [Scaptodrosophila lebanonensis]
MWLLLIIVLLLSAILLSHRNQKQRRDAVANLPGPYCLPLIGPVHLILTANQKNFFDISRKHVSKYGRIVKVWIFHRLLIFSVDVELSEQLLSSQTHLVKHPVYKTLAQWLGNGLLLSDGRTWHQRRKIITPTFHFKILEQFVEVFDQQSSTCIERLAERADGLTAFNVHPYICLAALDIIAETAMGTKVYAQTAESTPYAKAVNECTELLAWRLLNIFLQNEVIFTLTQPHLKLRQKKLIGIMHEFTNKVIEQRRSALEARQRQGQVNAYNDVGAKQRMALLDVLLQATVDGKQLTNAEIREEVDTFMFEGHDTTTSAICFTLVLLSRHPEVQEKLLAEVCEVLGSDNKRPITMRDLTDLKYMESVIKESLRTYPPIPLIGRKLQEDFKYTHSKYGDGVVPAGTEIIIGIMGSLNDAEQFPEPNKFRPERHEDGAPSSAYAMIPFSAGPRNCIGQKFALLEMKVMLAKIVREFELLPLGEEVMPVINIVMSSKTGFQLGMRRRIDTNNVAPS